MNKYIGVKDKFSDRQLNVLSFIDVIKFDEYLKDKEILLDIGCGTGNLVEHYQLKNKQIIGLTYNWVEVKFAQELKRNVIYGDAHNIQFPDNNFDGIFMIDCLEHCIAPLQVLKEIKRILKDKGRGIIYIPPEDWISCSYHIIVPNLMQMRHLFKLCEINLINVEMIHKQGIIYYIEVNK